MQTWVDLSDLIHYFRYHRSPSGIQRVQISILRLWTEQVLKREGIRYFEIDQESGKCVEVSAELIRHFDAICNASDAGPRARVKASVEKLFKGWLPGDVFIGGRMIGIGCLRIAKYLVRKAVGVSKKVRRAVVPRKARAEAAFQPGDLVVNLGSPWWNPHFKNVVRSLRQEHKVKFGSLIYDIIPHLYPEFFPIDFRKLFENWLEFCAVESDFLMTISESSKRDISDFTAKQGKRRTDIDVIPLGSDFFQGSSALSMSRETIERLKSRDYVLFVSTLEVRKNHQLLFLVWKELIKRHGDKAPRLVFAGRTGWMVEDLIKKIENSDHLGGAIEMISAPNDADIDWLYRNCLFTAYPSIYEGWGLPVAESLQRGKVCVASKSSSLPEIAGPLLDYFDPYDWRECLEKIEKVAFDTEYRHAQEKRALERFRAAGWQECSESLLERLMRYRA